MNPIQIDEFSAALATRFGLATTEVTAGAEFFGELEFDSFDAMMLVVWIETLAEPLALPSDLPPIYTVDDAHRYYLSLTETWTR